ELETQARSTLRSNIYLVSESIAKIAEQGRSFTGPERAALLRFKSNLELLTKYIPAWVKVAVAVALGLGTMIGWERIVVTVGEKIGKTHLTYAQGASAELVAAAP